MQAEIDAVLEFWFGNPQVEDVSYQQRRNLWFRKDPEFDQVVRDRFLNIHTQAASGELDHWQTSPDGYLALIVVLDQFPRNMFRGTAQAFATDSKALTVAKAAIAKQIDRSLPPIQRFFVYLPLEHSENLADQEQNVALTQRLLTDAPELEDVFEYAVRHRDVIARFGRFPHRNQMVGRASTPEEIEFLKQPGSSF